MPGSNNQMSQTFSQALKNDRAQEDQEFRQTMHSRQPVIQQADDNITQSEKRELAIMSNNENRIVHHQPLPDAAPVAVVQKTEA